MVGAFARPLGLRRANDAPAAAAMVALVSRDHRLFLQQVHTEFTRSRHGPIPAWAEGIKVFNYGGQKLQFSEQQRLLMIGRLANDKAAHYTYTAPRFESARACIWV